MKLEKSGRLIFAVDVMVSESSYCRVCTTAA